MANNEHSEPNPVPLFAREIEVARLWAQVEKLENQLKALQEEEDDRLESLRSEVSQLQEKFSYGKGVFAGIVVVLGAFGIFVVDLVKQVIAHLNAPP